MTNENSENNLLARLPALFRTDDASVSVGAGPDDCAHVLAPGGRVAFSTDVFAEGSHFLPDTPPALVAEKALLASASDLAASACRPQWALIGLCLKKNSPKGWAEAFAAGLAAAAKKWGIAVVGGDTVSSPSATVVTVTVAGEPLPGGPVLRGGGRPGDILAVTGMLGGSILGRHLRPEPRIAEISLLMRFARPTACMDISDGLALDLSRLCAASGCGALVEAARVPVSADARALAERTGKSPLSHALSDGEDFELLLAFPPESWRAAAAVIPLTLVGSLTPKPEGIRLKNADGTFLPLAAEGFEHQW